MPAIDHLKKMWKAIVPGVPLQYSFVDESIEKQYGNEQKMQGVFYAFAGLSLLIACLGLFGLSIFIVERKIKEIGIRKVLGASVAGIVGLLSKDFAKTRIDFCNDCNAHCMVFYEQLAGRICVSNYHKLVGFCNCGDYCVIDCYGYCKLQGDKSSNCQSCEEFKNGIITSMVNGEWSMVNGQ